MGRHTLAPVRKPFCTGRKAFACIGASLAFLLLGIAVREAEANQIGSSDNASLWVFAFSGLSLYAAVAIGWTAFRRNHAQKAVRQQGRSAR